MRLRNGQAARPRWTASAAGAMTRRTRLTGMLVAVTLALGLGLAARANAFVYWTDSVKRIGRATQDAQPAIFSSRVQPSFLSVVTAQSHEFAACGLAVDSAHIYWLTFGGTIGRANLDGTGASELFGELPSTGRGPCGIAVSGSHARADIYFTWNRLQPDGTGIGGIGDLELGESGFPVAVFLNRTGQPLPEPCGLAYQLGYLYWSDNGRGGNASIGRLDFNRFEERPNFISGPSVNPSCGVAVDSNFIYWSAHHHNPDASGIGRANLDGSSPSEVNFLSPGRFMPSNTPCGVAVDSANIYWADSATSSIGRASLDGVNVNQNFIHTGPEPCALAIDNLTPPLSEICTRCGELLIRPTPGQPRPAPGRRTQAVVLQSHLIGSSSVGILVERVLSTRRFHGHRVLYLQGVGRVPFGAAPARAAAHPLEPERQRAQAPAGTLPHHLAKARQSGQCHLDRQARDLHRSLSARLGACGRTMIARGGRSVDERRRTAQSAQRHGKYRECRRASAEWSHQAANVPLRPYHGM
jgi:low-density lipoprotein receptor class B